MKHLLISAAMILSPLEGIAGGLVYEAPAEPVLAAAPMGDQADWIIPLIALAAIVLLVQNSNDDSPPPSGCKQNCGNPPPPDCVSKSCVLIEVYGTDKWWSLPAEDEQNVRDYWVESGRAEGADDWSGYQAWLEGVTG
jgi:hypothetical protein